MRRILVLALVFFLLPCLVLSQTKEKKSKPARGGDAKQAVEKVDDELFSSVTKGGDFAAAVFEKNLGDDYVRVNPDGSLMNRSETINMYKTGQLKIESLTNNDRKIHVHGNTAISTREDTIKAHRGTTDISGTYRQSVVYVKGRDGQWKDVYFQTTKMQTPGK
jgi:ketosteroid isomerase-like protein